MATVRPTEGDGEFGWRSASPAGLWDVERRWMGDRKRGDETPLMGSLCRIRVCLKTHTETNSPPHSIPDPDPDPAVGDDSDMMITQHPRSQNAVLQVPLDRWVVLKMGEGQCDVIESCLEGMRAGESCEITVKAHSEDSNPTTCTDSDVSQVKRADDQFQCFSLHLHYFTPGLESWQMSPAEKWCWVQSHRQRGAQRFGAGDVWGAAQSYCCAVKLLITLKGHTRGKKRSHTEIKEGEEEDASTHNEEEEDEDDDVTGNRSSHTPSEEDYRTMKAELHCNLSLCQLRLQQPLKARTSSSRSVELISSSVKAWYRLGQASLQTGDFGEARRAFLKVLELQPDSTSARTALKHVNTKEKELDNKLAQRLSKMFS